MEYRIQCLDLQDLEKLSKCYRLFSVLRPHLDESEFVRRVRLQAKEAYIVAYIEIGDEVVGAAGYRVAHFLAWGRTLYVDDLIVLPDRTRSGLGSALLDWLVNESRRLQCNEVHLDTGFTRHDAHRLYLSKGFRLNCHHLARTAT